MWLKSLSFTLLICALTRNLYAQVDLQTGGVAATIPLYSYSDPDRLSFEVGLTYTGANGIKVNEIPSCVGLGWKLSAGGSISRITAGKPDDQYGNLGGYREKTGRMYIADNSQISDCYSDINTPRPEYFGYDREADVFTFSFNGNSGSFVIGRKSSTDTEYPITMLNDSKIKVRLLEEDMSTANVITRISTFIITTEDGIQYYFSDKELSEIFSSDPNMSSTPVDLNLTFVPVGTAAPTSDKIVVSPYHTGKYIVNNWYLTRVVNPLTNRAINYFYDTYNVDYSYLKLPIKTATINSSGAEEKINYTIVDQHVSGAMKRLKTIVATGGPGVNFVYDNNRIDIPGESALTGIEITSISDGVSNAKYKLNYQYHNIGSMVDYASGSGATDLQKSTFRLSLQSIEKNINNIASPFMRFTYKRNLIPSRGSMWQDMYGYYVGTFAYDRKVEDFFEEAKKRPAAINTLGSANRMAAEGAMLDTIVYGAGGYLTYTYENNTYDSSGVANYYGGVRVKSTTLYDGVDHANDQVVTYLYQNEDGTSSGVGYEKPVFTQDMSTYYIANGTHLASKIIYMATNAALSYYGGGSNAMISSATGNAGFLTLVDQIVSWIVGGRSAETGTITTRSWSGYPMASTNGLPFFYKRVVVLMGTEAASKGKIAYEFLDYTDRLPKYETIKAPYSFKQRIDSWAMGLTKRKTTYDANGNMLKDVLNDYSFSSTVKSGDNWLSCKCAVLNDVTPWSAQTNQKARMTFDKDSYYPVSGRASLVKTTTKDYFPDGSFTSDVISFEYDPTYYTLKKITKTNSQSETEESRIYYPFDYPAVTDLAKMVTNNNISTQISQENWVINGAGTRMINGETQIYATAPDGEVRSTGAYVFQSKVPLSESTIGVFNGSLNRAPAYFKQHDKVVYDASGNVVQIERDGNVRSQMFDYYHRKLAQAENAASSEMAFTGFELSSVVNWTYSLAGNIKTASGAVNQSMTGEYYYNLSNRSITKAASGMVSGKKYKISYWVSNGSGSTTNPVTLNYSGTVTKGVTYNNYTYYEHEFTMGTADISITGNVNIDNLRLYPSNATMTSYDYDAASKTTAVIDANNKIMTYQYDDQHRIKTVIDQYNNLLKHYDYNFR